MGNCQSGVARRRESPAPPELGLKGFEEYTERPEDFADAECYDEAGNDKKPAIWIETMDSHAPNHPEAARVTASDGRLMGGVAAHEMWRVLVRTASRQCVSVPRAGDSPQRSSIQRVQTTIA